MQNTNFRNFLIKFLNILTPTIYTSWSKRSISLLSILLGYYLTNSFLSYLLDKSINTIFLAIIIILIMELLIQLSLLSSIPKLSLMILSLNNFRIGSTYALILEAYKLGS